MSQNVIIVENLGKKYSIRHQQSRQPYVALRDVLAEKAKRLLAPGRNSPENQTGVEDFWALKNVSFEVKEGEVLGIIGRNGAGKSTLLKILSRITEPTEGRVKVRGRIASLLEVGTGFHPELTGRENIFLNGAILGMSREEIRRKFDEIVAFAEIEKFLDTPVKRYSSGMYVRLAFAVAAHLEPEILIVDEVLAVGDAEFQKKCLGKMGEVAKGGRTVLFVSHNISLIEQLCSYLIWLSRGIICDSSQNIRHIVNRYCSLGGISKLFVPWAREGARYYSPWFSPLSLKIINDECLEVKEPVFRDNNIYLFLEFHIKQKTPDLTIGFYVANEMGDVILSSWTVDMPEECWPQFKTGDNTCRVKIPTEMLHDGIYSLHIMASLYMKLDIIPFGHDSPEIWFEVRGFRAQSPYYTHSRQGRVAPQLRWLHE